jgi:hypothetical protein
VHTPFHYWKTVRPIDTYISDDEMRETLVRFSHRRAWWWEDIAESTIACEMMRDLCGFSTSMDARRWIVKVAARLKRREDRAWANEARAVAVRSPLPHVEAHWDDYNRRARWNNRYAAK